MKELVKKTVHKVWCATAWMACENCEHRAEDESWIYECHKCEHTINAQRVIERILADAMSAKDERISELKSLNESYLGGQNEIAKIVTAKDKEIERLKEEINGTLP